MAKVVFVTPTYKKDVLGESIGTLLLATILKKHGIQSDIMPFYSFGEQVDFSEFLATAVEKICSAQPEIVSFYTRCDCYHTMLKMAREIKKKCNCYIVFGGPQADISAKETIEEIEDVDFVCCGEGENTIVPFFSSLLQHTPKLDVAGLVYRDGEKIVANPRPELIADLDSIPMLDMSVFAEEKVFNTQRPFPIDVGRGCPFGCTYCSTKSFWGQKYRLKSPERIIEEIKYYHNLFGVTYFAFEHDMFTANRNKVREICRLIQTLDFKTTWKCSARIDCIDEELIDTMVEAGMKQIYIGIETGSARMQKLINKNLKLDNVPKMISYICAKGVSVIVSFIYGFPEERQEDVSDTLALIAKIIHLKKVSIQAHLCAFLPGTELSSCYKDKLTPTTLLSDITGSVGVEECADIITAHPSLFWHFSEYTTELRHRLRYIYLFIRMWHDLLPVYRHFAETYEKSNLVQMYFDFAQDNAETLATIEGQPVEEQINALVKNDAFAQRFSDDGYADMIADIYRLESAKKAVLSGESPEAIEVVCVSPVDLEKCGHLQECVRSRYIVAFSKSKDNRVLRKISGLAR